MFKLFLCLCSLLPIISNAQIIKEKEERKGIRLPKYVATKRSFGMIGGIERGNITFLELGVESHWKKIRLKNARTLAANVNMEYNFGNNILGYNAAGWIKKGRVNLTYGVNFNYVTDFTYTRYGMGPQIGFRLLGFHIVNGYNFLLGDEELDRVNKFYVGLRYYFPLDKKTKTVNVNKKKKK
ncbi:MAG: hypothetical protein ACNS60_13495 [Candidatus Cyclobacteriaceae bacterium M2_1C_046]